jgi:uncharacterized membrane protein
MNGEFLTLTVTYLLVAALIVAHPWFTRKNVLFGVVFGSADVWNANRIKAIRRHYLVQASVLALTVGAALALCALTQDLSEGALAGTYTGFLFLMIIAEMAPFVMANRRTKAFKAASKPEENLVKDIITVETGISESRAVLSAGWALLLVPLLLADVLLAVLGYDRMPAQIAIHYGLSGPDAWTAKTAAGVIGSVMSNVLLTGILLLAVLYTRRAPASVRGNPEAAPEMFRYRKMMVLTLIFAGLFSQAIFLVLMIANFTAMPAFLMNLLLALLLILVAALFFIYFRFVRRKKPKGRIIDDDTRWIFGMLYYNPSDPAVFVEKRMGIGYTLNFARPMSWVFFLGVIALILCSIFLF